MVRDAESASSIECSSVSTLSYASADDAPLSDPSVVIDDVEHSEPAAVIDPIEAEMIVHESWATAIQASHVQLSSRLLSECPVRAIVALALTKHSKEIEQALLRSPLAREAREAGIDVEPSWAAGAKIFVDGIGSDLAREFRVVFGQRIGLAPNHVIVEAKDEERVLQALRPHPRGRAMATAKPGSRMELLQGDNDDCFRCSSHSMGTVQTDEFILTLVEQEEVKVIVKNTFWDILHASSSSDAKSAQTW